MERHRTWMKVRVCLSLMSLFAFCAVWSYFSMIEAKSKLSEVRSQVADFSESVTRSPLVAVIQTDEADIPHSLRRTVIAERNGGASGAEELPQGDSENHKTARNASLTETLRSLLRTRTQPSRSVKHGGRRKWPAGNPAAQPSDGRNSSWRRSEQMSARIATRTRRDTWPAAMAESPIRDAKSERSTSHSDRPSRTFPGSAVQPGRPQSSREQSTTDSLIKHRALLPLQNPPPSMSSDDSGKVSLSPPDQSGVSVGQPNGAPVTSKLSPVFVSGALTDAPIEAPPAPPSEAPVEVPTGAPTEVPAEAPMEASTNTPSHSQPSQNVPDSTSSQPGSAVTTHHHPRTDAADDRPTLPSGGSSQAASQKHPLAKPTAQGKPASLTTPYPAGQTQGRRRTTVPSWRTTPLDGSDSNHSSSAVPATNSSAIQDVEERTSGSECSGVGGSGCDSSLRSLNLAASDSYWAVGSLMTILLLLTAGVLYTGLWKKRNSMSNPMSDVSCHAQAQNSPSHKAKTDIKELLKKKLSHLKNLNSSPLSLSKGRRNGHPSTNGRYIHRYDRLPLLVQAHDVAVTHDDNGDRDDDFEEEEEEEEEFCREWGPAVRQSNGQCQPASLM